MADFVQVDPDSPQAVEALSHYFDELNDRFGTGFDPVAGGADSDREHLTWPAGVFLLVVEDGVVVGCGGVQTIDTETAEIKRMWIDHAQRGRGLGRSLLSRLEAESMRLGRPRVVLDTNGTLKEAIAMYERAGYQPIDRYNDNPYAEHFFEKRLDP